MAIDALQSHCQGCSPASITYAANFLRSCIAACNSFDPGSSIRRPVIANRHPAALSTRAPSNLLPATETAQHSGTTIFVRHHLGSPGCRQSSPESQPLSHCRGPLISACGECLAGSVEAGRPVGHCNAGTSRGSSKAESLGSSGTLPRNQPGSPTWRRFSVPMLRWTIFGPRQKGMRTERTAECPPPGGC